MTMKLCKVLDIGLVEEEIMEQIDKCQSAYRKLA